MLHTSASGFKVKGRLGGGSGKKVVPCLKVKSPSIKSELLLSRTSSPVYNLLSI